MILAQPTSQAPKRRQIPDEGTSFTIAAEGDPKKGADAGTTKSSQSGGSLKGEPKGGTSGTTIPRTFFDGHIINIGAIDLKKFSGTDANPVEVTWVAGRRARDSSFCLVRNTRQNSNTPQNERTIPTQIPFNTLVNEGITTGDARLIEISNGVGLFLFCRKTNTEQFTLAEINQILSGAAVLTANPRPR